MFRSAHSLPSPSFLHPQRDPEKNTWGAGLGGGRLGALTLGLRPYPYCLRPKDATYRGRLLSVAPPPSQSGKRRRYRIAIPPYSVSPPRPPSQYLLWNCLHLLTRNRRRGLRSSSRFSGDELWSLATREARQQGCW